MVGYGNITNYGSDKLRFISPVPAGSTVHARCRLIAVEAKPKGTLCTEEMEISVVGQPPPGAELPHAHAVPARRVSR